RIEADPHDQHPQQRPADAADELAAIAQRAFYLAQPAGVESAELRRDGAHARGRGGCGPDHRVCSPPRLPNACGRSRRPATWSRSSRPGSDRNTVSRLGFSTTNFRSRPPWRARNDSVKASPLDLKRILLSLATTRCA